MNDTGQEHITELSNGDLSVRIEDGELRSFSRNGQEFMHQPSEPGWRHSDTEMFPVIGPTRAAGYKVQVPRGNAIQDQHGLLRELAYKRTDRTPHSAVFEKEYTAGTPVPNSKYPDRSEMRLLIWPYSFRVVKHFVLGPGSLELVFHIHGEQDMPYMFGYHPAFRVRRAGTEILANGNTIRMEEVLDAGDTAMEVPDCEFVQLRGITPLSIRTAGFTGFMLWSPDPGMLCVEPITWYPYSAGPENLHRGFRHLDGNTAEFSVILKPGDY